MSEVSVEFSQKAASYFRRLDKTQKQRVTAKLKEIQADPGATSLQLVNQGKVRRARVGDLRILFEYDEVGAKLLVVAIGPRGDIYKHMN